MKETKETIHCSKVTLVEGPVHPWSSQFSIYTSCCDNEAHNRESWVNCSEAGVEKAFLRDKLTFTTDLHIFDPCSWETQ